MTILRSQILTFSTQSYFYYYNLLIKCIGFVAIHLFRQT